MQNSFGNSLRYTIFGASHSDEVGIVIDGLPSGITLDRELFATDMDRRRPMLRGETTRHEADTPVIEGVDECGRTTGESVSIKFSNNNIRSKDYSHLKSHPRPSHADYVQRHKYGEEYDLSGGGMASGRMTVALVAAGVVAKQLLSGVSFDTRLIQVGAEHDASRFEEVIANARMAQDSVGGVIECRVQGVPMLLGEPFFDSAESIISHMLFSIPGIKGVEFGDGFASAAKYGSERNDRYVDAAGHTATNNEGGINGGITNGNDIVVRVAVKPTPSIGREQLTFDMEYGQMRSLKIGGRHDSCIARRAVVVVEAVVAMALAELSLRR
ncbi:MAG: chorismate synthase [Alistipes sp.]|nr:chorismate synthase [Alistipes sp.]